MMPGRGTASFDSGDADELQQAMLAAFGEDALEMLDEQDSIPTGFAGLSLETQGGLEWGQETDPTIAAILEKTIPDASDSDRSRWIKQLTAAVYAKRLTSRFAADPTEAGNAPKPASQRVVLFSVGEYQFGVPQSHVRQVGRCPNVTRLPQAPVWLRGIIQLHGQILSVTDLQALFQIKGAAAARQKIVVVNRPGQTESTAMVVDQLWGIQNWPEETEPIPPEHPAAAYADNLTIMNDRATVLIELERLFLGLGSTPPQSQVVP